jgi:hypothetical protein
MFLELLSAVLIIFIPVVFFKSSSLSMPMNVTSTLIVLLILAFLILAAFVWREKPEDERESLISMMAGRAAYLLGVGVLVIGIVYQVLMQEIDPWLILSLCVMILAKLGFLFYSRYKL